MPGEDEPSYRNMLLRKLHFYENPDLRPLQELIWKGMS